MEQIKKPELSLVIPVYNEEANLEELIRRCLAACDPLDMPYEIILVDEGSADSSAVMIREAAEKHDGKIVGVFLTTNFGQHAAVTAGLQRDMMSSARSGKNAKTPFSAVRHPKWSTSWSADSATAKP